MRKANMPWADIRTLVRVALSYMDKWDEDEVAAIKTAAKALASLELQEKVLSLSEWRSVKDEPPTEAGWVWAGWILTGWRAKEHDGSLVNLVDVSIDNSGTIWWLATAGQGYTDVRVSPTHWMPIEDWPLPPAPRLEAPDG